MQVFDDPLVHFDDWYNEADKIANFDANAVALATVGRNGQPSVRMILFKGLVKGGFSFYTNYDSRKGREIALNNRGALLFYWQPLNRQIRIEGSLFKMPRQLSKKYFASRPLFSQLSSVISQQSREISSYRDLQTQFEQATATSNQQPVSCPKHWGGYTLSPNRFEFFIANQHRLNERLSYRRANDVWQHKYLSP